MARRLPGGGRGSGGCRMWEAAGHLLRQKVALLCVSSQLIRFSSLLLHTSLLLSFMGSAEIENVLCVCVCACVCGKPKPCSDLCEAAGLLHTSVAITDSAKYITSRLFILFAIAKSVHNCSAQNKTTY